MGTTRTSLLNRDTQLRRYSSKKWMIIFVKYVLMTVVKAGNATIDS